MTTSNTGGYGGGRFGKSNTPPIKPAVLATSPGGGGNLCPQCGGSLLPSKYMKRGVAQVYCSNFRDRPGKPGCKYTADAAGAKRSAVVGAPTDIPVLTTLSDEQQTILDWAAVHNDNIIIKALAGTGKTTESVQLVRVFVGLGFSVQCLAFAKRDAEALTPRVCGRATVNTSNSAGFRILNNYARRAGFRISEVNSFIPYRMMEARLRAEGKIKDDGAGTEIWELARPVVSTICDIVDKARSTLALSAVDETLPRIPSEAQYNEIIERFGLEVETDELVNVLSWCAWLFAECASLDNLKTWGTDYTNQVFLPSYYNLKPDQTFDRVIVDEAQDQNYINRRIAELHVKPGTGRIVAVGDENQAIYGWRGADSDALGEMAKLMERLGGIPKAFPLTLCRRCSKSVIRVAQTIVPTIQALPNAVEGEVSRIPTDEAFATHLAQQRKGLVLCRANAPLISMCLKLLAQGIPAAIAKSDIVGQLIRLIEKASGEAGDDCLVPDVLSAVAEWADGQYTKLAKRCGGDKLAQVVRDKVDAINALAMGDEIKTAGDIKRRIDTLFPAGQDKVPMGERAEKLVLFSTVHGAKGGEAKTVYLYSPDSYKTCLWDLVWDSERDRDNVLYVAITRAEHTLVFAGQAPSLQRLSEFDPNDVG